MAKSHLNNTKSRKVEAVKTGKRPDKVQYAVQQQSLPEGLEIQAEKTAEEIGGREQGLEPTRYGDWEKKGRCIDF